MNTTGHRQQIDDFEKHYDYDSTYMRELLETSPDGYEKFAAFLPLAGHRELLDRDDFWIAKLAGMRSEDCGACLQLNVRMALEAGVDRELVSAAVRTPAELPEALRDVYDFATAVAANNLSDQALIERIEARFDKGQLLELGLCISTTKIFPTIKRAVGYAKSCRLIEIAVS